MSLFVWSWTCFVLSTGQLFKCHFHLSYLFLFHCNFLCLSFFLKFELNNQYLNFWNIQLNTRCYNRSAELIIGGYIWPSLLSIMTILPFLIVMSVSQFSHLCCSYSLNCLFCCYRGVRSGAIIKGLLAWNASTDTIGT